MRLVLLALLVSMTSVASARPVTIGAALGLTQAKVDANQDPNTALSVFGRLGFNQRAAVQVELQRIDTDNNSESVRTGTLLLALDLGSSKHLMPMLLAGAGLDWESSGYESTDAHHFEGGVGLEYRADGGLVVGGDLRIGGRSIDAQTSAPGLYPANGTALYLPSSLQEGEYRSARAYVGVRF